MKRSKNKMVLNDMLKQNEEKLKVAKVYYHGSKIENQRKVVHHVTTNKLYTEKNATCYTSLIRKTLPRHIPKLMI